MMHLDSIRDTIGVGPGVVLWCYREAGGGPYLAAANPFAEFAELGGAKSEVLYRRCFNVVQPPACRFPVRRFVELLPQFRVAILHNPEVFSDFYEVLPELAKACVGHNVRLVLVSDWHDFLDRCAVALDPLSELLPVQRVGAGNGQRNAA